jgi:hypothetical protein
MEEMHEFLDLTAAFFLCGGKVLRIGRIDSVDTGAIDYPLVLFY